MYLDLIIFSFLASVSGLPFGRDWSNLGIKSTEKVSVKLKTKDNFRFKRSANNHPKQLTFQYTSKSVGDVTIELKKNNIQKIPPVLLYDGINLKNKTDINIGDFALYYNTENKASALVKFYSDDLSHYHIHATYIIGSSWFTLEPSETPGSRIKRQAVPSLQTSPEKTTAHPALNREYLVYEMLFTEGQTFFNDTFVLKENPDFTTDPQLTTERITESNTTTQTVPVFNFRDRGKRSSPTTEKKKRTKRQIPVLYVEYLVCIDYANYIIWKEMSTATDDAQKHADAENMIIQFYLFVTNGINTRYESLMTPEGDVKVILAGFVIATNIEASKWTEDNVISSNVVNDGNTLLTFSQWINANRNTDAIPNHDHAALFTGYDLAEKITDKRTIGIAYLSRVCNSYASSVNEETFNAMIIHIAAHELAHNLGASHDSYHSNGCSAEFGYVMSPSLPNSEYSSATSASRNFIFSSCSRASIGSYIAGLETKCLENSPMDGLVDLTLAAFNPGETVYGVDDQCRLTYAPNGGSAMCRENYPLTTMKWASVCYRLQCRNPANLNGPCSSQFAHDGTACGNYKWCQQGQCVSSVDAPNVPDICPFGDDPLFNCDINQCNQYGQQIRSGKCCYTCLVPKTTTSTSTSTTTTTPTTTTTTPTTTTTTPTTTITTPTTTTTTQSTTTRVIKTTRQTSMNTPVPSTDKPFTQTFDELADHDLKTAMALFVHLVAML